MVTHPVAAAGASAVALKSVQSAGSSSPALQQLILAILLGGLAIAFVSQDWLWRWDLVFYDAALSLESRRAPDDLIIIAVDDESLSRIGRWPWPRRIHADLLRRLRAEGAAAIGFDILLPEVDARDPPGDAALAQAIHNNKRTVLPMVMEQSRIGGQPLEMLPAQAFSEVSAAIAHVHVEFDRDGLARSLFLRAGLGDPHWLAFSEAVLRVADPDRSSELPGARAPPANNASAYVWMRDYHILVPFVGPPGSIRRISYAQALSGAYPPNTFTNRIVLVGTTATGLADDIPTPVSGYGAQMPGVEFHANALTALRAGNTITIAPMPLRAALSVLFVLIPLVLYPRLPPSGGLLAALTLIVAVFATSAGVLAFGRIWCGPAPTFLLLALSYPLWSWLRLEFAMRYLSGEIERLQREQVNLASGGRPALAERLSFAHAILASRGLLLVDPNGMVVESAGQAPALVSTPIEDGAWTSVEDELWAGVQQGDGLWRVGMRWQAGSRPAAAEQRLLNASIRLERRALKRESVSRIEVVQQRVTQMQHASARLRTLRGLIDGTLQQMQHGMLLIDVLGRVQLANRQAALFLLEDQDSELLGHSALDLLGKIEVEPGPDWAQVFKRVLVEDESMRVDCRHADGRDLLGHVAPMHDEAGETSGVILNLADISALKQSERRRAEMLSFVSHDLRSPLVSIMALSELAETSEAGAEHGAALHRAGQYAARTLNLTEEFLALAHAESDDELAAEEVDMIMVAMDAIDSVWPQAEAKSIDLEPRIEIDEAHVLGDAGMLERVLVNLLTNAVKYSPEAASVGIELTREGETLCCCVFDTGYGIAPDDLERLFERFERVQREEHVGERGIGLGLAFVRATVERHGGRIEVESQLNKGSRFRILLPAIDR